MPKKSGRKRARSALQQELAAAGSSSDDEEETRVASDAAVAVPAMSIPALSTPSDVAALEASKVARRASKKARKATDPSDLPLSGPAATTSAPAVARQPVIAAPTIPALSVNPNKPGEPQLPPPASVEAEAGAATLPASGPLLDGSKRWSDRGRQYRKGKFSKEEDAILDDAIRSYCEMNDLGDNGRAKLLAGGRDPSIKGAWIQIASVLPDRTIISVYDHCRRRFSATNYRGRWKEEEIAELRSLVQQHGHDWMYIGNRLHRLPAGCRDKWREVKANFSTGRWSHEEKLQLVRLVAKSLVTQGSLTPEQAEHIIAQQQLLCSMSTAALATAAAQDMTSLAAQGKDLALHHDADPAQLREQLQQHQSMASLDLAMRNNDINWTAISEAMGTRSHSQCRHMWYRQLNPQINRPPPIEPNEYRGLVHAVAAASAETMDQVPWDVLMPERLSGSQAKDAWMRLVRSADVDEHTGFPAQVAAVSKYLGFQ